MTEKELEDIIGKATEKSIKKVLGEFNVDRETHWKHHTALSSFFKMVATTRKVVWVVFVTSGALGLIGLIGKFVGFVLKGE